MLLDELYITLFMSSNQSNQQIITLLSELAECYKKDYKLKIKYKAINAAVNNIRKFPDAILSGEDALTKINGIGDGIAKRINEILTTGTLAELQNFRINPDATLDKINDLKRITGLGDKRAELLVKEGIDSVDKYRKAVAEGRAQTTHHIQVGLKWFDDLEQKIPRQEIEEMERFLQNTLAELDSELMMNICGSYRRGRALCGDIDVLVTKKQNPKNIAYLPLFVDALTKKGFLVDHLTSHGDKKYMGVCKMQAMARSSGLGRRIDIRYVDYSAFWAAIIYFTGSMKFNVDIRRIALASEPISYSLSEYGLKEKESGKMIILHSEEELFDLLKIPYVPPTERDIQ